jgi:sulfur-oxidizing protein SoxZ
MKKMRIKAKEKNGVVTVKAMIKHEMLSYDQAAKKGKKANFITYVIAKVDGKPVFEMSSSQFLSKDPYLKFQFKGQKGQEIEMHAEDLSGDKRTDKKKVK